LREHERGVCAVHVLVDTEIEPPKIAGYFTLSSETIVPAELPARVAKRYPRYPRWGAVKLGRMARDDAYANLGLGVTLVRAAFQVVLRVGDIGSIAIVVDAKNARLASWYERTCGFTPFDTRPLTLFIMRPTMQELLDASREGV
jgi:GNAT superfamily N-acetyltransferase